MWWRTAWVKWLIEGDICTNKYSLTVLFTIKIETNPSLLSTVISRPQTCPIRKENQLQKMIKGCQKEPISDIIVQGVKFKSQDDIVPNRSTYQFDCIFSDTILVKIFLWADDFLLPISTTSHGMSIVLAVGSSSSIWRVRKFSTSSFTFNQEFYIYWIVVCNMLGGARWVQPVYSRVLFFIGRLFVYCKLDLQFLNQLVVLNRNNKCFILIIEYK